MNDRSYLIYFRGIVVQLAVSLAVALALGAGTTLAADVNCDLSGSIQAFLNGLDKNESRTVTISGTCTESVLVEGFRDLTLSGGTIQRPRVTEWPGALPPLTVMGSEKVAVNSMTFQDIYADTTGSKPLISILRSNFVMGDCTVRASKWDGLAIGDHSTADIWRSTFEDNAGTAISVGEDSRVNVSYVWWDEARTTIRGNGSGIGAGSGAVVNVVHVLIEDNKSGAVGASSGALVNLGGWGEWAPTIEGNGTADTPAVRSTNDGEVWILPYAIIRNNPGDGAVAGQGGRLYICCGEGTSISGNGGFGLSAWADGGIFFWAGALIEKNLRGGISLSASQLFMNPGVQIQYNGDSTDSNSYGGVILDSNAVAWGTFTIMDNYGPGVFLKGGGSAVFYGNTSITRNKGYGVQLELDAKAEFSNNNSVTGNKRFDLFCAPGSTAGVPKGARPTISKMSCQGWTQLTPLPAWANQR